MFNSSYTIRFVLLYRLICVLLADGKQYRFATYNGSKVKSVSRHEYGIDAIITRRSSELKIHAKSTDFSVLKAPTLTGMDRDTEESNNTDYDVNLSYSGKKNLQ